MMNLDSEKTNPCTNRLLLNPKGIFAILRDRDAPTIYCPCHLTNLTNWILVMVK